MYMPKQGYILCKILWPGGEGIGAGEKNEKEGKRGKEKEEKGKGESDFFVNIRNTFVDYCILT